MESVVGVFPLRTEAERAATELAAAGMAKENISVLTPEASERELAGVPTEDAEPPGVGSAIGAAVGAAVGLSGASLVGPVASVLVPGVGPVLVIGAAALALVGATAGGALAGRALEHSLQDGLPKDELFFYEEALRQDRSVLIASARDGEEAELARGVLERAGAEDLDAARGRWWLGLGDAQEAQYDLPSHDVAVAEALFRRGFEAALRSENRGRALDEVAGCLEDEETGTYAFRFGYERGQAYYRKWQQAG